MRALITGIAGFVGSHLADFLIKHTDWDIYGLIRWQDSLENIGHLVPLINVGNRVYLRYGDLNDAGSIRKVVESIEPDYVFHLAAQSYPQTSFDSPVDTINTNTIGTLNVLESLVGSLAWIHICSSSEVYGRVSHNNVPIKEDCPFNPASPYAISKVGTDLLGQHYADRGLNVVVTRMFTHTGPRRGDVFSESSFAKQIAMIDAGKLSPPIKVGNLESIRTIADVRDAVRAYYMALTVNPKSDVYNIGGNHSCSIKKILYYLIGSRRYDVEVDPQRLRPVDADLQVPDCTKFKKHTGWEPEITFDETLNDLFAYWQEKVKECTPLQR